MSASKSNVRMTFLRTGHGDTGDTKLGGKTYRKGHALVSYSAALDVAQAHTNALPLKFGDFKPRILLQELLFRLGATIGSRSPKDQEIALQELGEFMEGHISTLVVGLNPLDSFIRCHELNHDLQKLRTFVRDAETKCFAARDHIELESKETSPNLIYMLEKSGKALNIASDWVFAFIWMFSTDDAGKLIHELKWTPMSDEEIKVLNV